MRLSTKLSGIVAIGGVAALGAGLISSGGIGAQFTDQAKGTANITTGTFSCEFQDLGNGVNYSQDSSGKWHTATVNLPDMQSSTGSERATVRVKNTGSMPAFVKWSVTPSGSLFHNYNVADASISPVPVIGTAILLPGHSEDANIGFVWNGLDNNYLGKSGTATYTINCEEGPQFGTYGPQSDSSAWLFDNNKVHGESASWDASAKAVTLDPGASGAGGAAGIRMQVAKGSTLPSVAPTYEYDEWPTASGQLRFNIYFTNGTHAFWSPEQQNWSVGTTGLTHTSNDWTSFTDAATAAGLIFDHASVITDFPPIVHVSCVNYTGTPLFGSC